MKMVHDWRHEPLAFFRDAKTPTPLSTGRIGAGGISPYTDI
jgi:hypothetical protein